MTGTLKIMFFREKIWKRNNEHDNITENAGNSKNGVVIVVIVTVHKGKLSPAMWFT